MSNITVGCNERSELHQILKEASKRCNALRLLHPTVIITLHDSASIKNSGQDYF